ncbi:Ornithine carbamoyltransferase [Fulvivirga imtechensis AK7]|uniref:Ornithine carbamoyltransferase n=1 Tax=Fulvivirga imtechensis AK7 TaxID=1237149 RepID=L8JXE3_9BACT|nr:ornithine carbamoyltransferase [Fulvivirga imtechensis]ELR72279.1 Ornithine carbamoyltransferase [Fulvivirga imtechensis AK7]
MDTATAIPANQASEKKIDKPRNFLDIRDFSHEELLYIIELTEKIKKGELDVTKVLSNKHFGLLFGSASTRTRVSFQVGIRQMGGFAEHLSTADLQLSNHENIKDTSAVLGRFLDGLIVRLYDMDQYGQGRENLKLISRYANIPIISALDDKDHPCQVMADLFTLKEKFGPEYKKKKLVFTWAYAERQKSPGVPHSMLSAASMLGMNVTFAHPKGFDLDKEYVEYAQAKIGASGGHLSFSNDLMEASENADVIYAKSWKAMYIPKEEEYKLRNKVRPYWTVSERHFKVANKGALFMNCLPIIRGEQATTEVIDRPDSILYDEAENRLHAQKAILYHLYKQ